MALPLPGSLKSEHDALLTTLSRATREPGALGVAATALSHVLRPHLQREEELVFPNLALLRKLGSDAVKQDLAAATQNASRLETELPQLLAEHKRITEFLQGFLTSAREVNKTEYAEYAYRLVEHMRLEEEVLYPAAILVGGYARK